MHDPVSRSLHLHEDEDHESDQEEPREEPDQDLEEAGRFNVVFDFDAGREHLGGDVSFVLLGILDHEVVRVLGRTGVDEAAADAVAPLEDDHLCDLAGLEPVLEVG